MPKRKRNEDIVPGATTEQVLKFEALPWASACAVELAQLWNELLPGLSHELTLQGFDQREREQLLTPLKKILFRHRDRVLLQWTKPYVLALVDIVRAPEVTPAQLPPVSPEATGPQP